MTGQAGCLPGDALLHTAVAGEDPHMVIERAAPHLGDRVEQTTDIARVHSHAHSRRVTLAERAGRGLDAHGVAVLRMSGGLTTPGTEGLQVAEL